MNASPFFFQGLGYGVHAIGGIVLSAQIGREGVGHHVFISTQGNAGNLYGSISRQWVRMCWFVLIASLYALAEPLIWSKHIHTVSLRVKETRLERA